MRNTTRIASLVAVIAVAAAAHAGTAAAQGVSTLKLAATGTGATVQAAPTGRLLGCSGVTCTYEYTTGTPVVLTAVSTVPGASLATWLGGCTGATPSCSLVVSGQRAVTARFTPVQIYADQQTGKGGVSISPPAASCGFRCWSVPYGTQVTLTASAAAGYAFKSWSGACANVRVAGCLLNAHSTVITSPNFDCTGDVCSIGQPITHEVKTVVRVQGRGYVQVNGKDCRGACTLTFKRGKTIVLRAYGTGGRFAGWSGSCAGTAARCQFLAFKDARGQPPAVNAVFG